MTKQMKRIGLRAAVLFCGAGLVMVSAQARAQDAPPPPLQGGQQQGPPQGGRGMRDPGARAAQLQQQLGLTDDVTAKVKTIFTDGTAKMQALRQSGGSREDMMAIRSDETTKVKALLTPDQQTKYDALLEAQRGRGGPPPSGGAPQQL
jgi:periplasmic protein CpxP/Spy